MASGLQQQRAVSDQSGRFLKTVGGVEAAQDLVDVLGRAGAEGVEELVQDVVFLEQRLILPAKEVGAALFPLDVVFAGAAASVARGA